jgi:hypothetical protein
MSPSCWYELIQPYNFKIQIQRYQSSANEPNWFKIKGNNALPTEIEGTNFKYFFLQDNYTNFACTQVVQAHEDIPQFLKPCSDC